MADDIKSYLDVALEAARSGAAVLESWRHRFQIREKARADLVTDADIESQAAIRTHLSAFYPSHAFLGEEDFAGKPFSSLKSLSLNQPTWVCDPLDGTSNFAHDIPAYCVNIALLIDGEPVVAVTHDPRMGEVFHAAKGQGAFLNDKTIRVSAVSRLESSVLATGFPSDYKRQMRNFKTWEKLAEKCQGLRRTGSTALNMAYVAAGRFDGYWCYDNWPWDVAAGWLLVTEAGGRVSNSQGDAFNPFEMDIGCSNGLIHDEMIAMVK